MSRSMIWFRHYTWLMLSLEYDLIAKVATGTVVQVVTVKVLACNPCITHVHAHTMPTPSIHTYTHIHIHRETDRM